MARFPSVLAYAALIVFPSILSRVFTYVQRQRDSGYSDQACMLKIVNDTNPEHYALHPLWSLIEPDTQCSSAEYLHKQHTNKVDGKLTTRVMQTLTIGSVVGLAVTAFYGKVDSMGLVGIFLMCERMGQEMQGYGHLYNDITQMSGTILHHSPGWTGLGSGENNGDPAMPEGQFNALVIPMTTFAVVMYFVTKGTRYSSLAAMFSFIPVCLATSGVHMRQHSRVHELGEAAAASWWPWDMWYYKCHIQGHHYDGSFCSVLNPALIVYDPVVHFLAYLMRNGVRHGSTLWEAICVGTELFVAATTVLKMWLIVRAIGYVHTWAEQRCGAMLKTRTE